MSLISVGIGSADFINGPLADFGQTVSVVPATIVEDFRGNKTETYSTGTYTQTVVFIQKIHERDRMKLGIRELKGSVILYRTDSPIKLRDMVIITNGTYTDSFKVQSQIDRQGVYRISEIYLYNEA